MALPVAGTRQFVAIGLNYADHAAETGQAAPPEPVIFTKAVSCIQGCDDDVRKPRLATKMDWEVELGIVIEERASYVDKGEALDHVAGFLVVDDLSERQFQMERGQTWDRGKGCRNLRTGGPMAGDRRRSRRSTGARHVARRQRQAHADGQHPHDDLRLRGACQLCERIHGAAARRHHHHGNAAGVGMGMTPQVWLEEGDVIELGIEEVGRQRHKVIASNHGR